ncbi:nucleotidyltransferase domain-containing protein [Frigoribacterium sp. UYMn621]|uniref:nucleotidyltransferase domain-containing protein n=1 Tax=Frigoribacterium sp. UYMn621 TaxID=3156343 RepID=UPI00339B01ED
MFDTSEREEIREQLTMRARADPDIVGAALVGSGALGQEDEWSDIDLVLQLADYADEKKVVARWTKWIDEQFSTADILDVMAGGVRYRVFLLNSSLQIDLSFFSYGKFRATGNAFRLLFGSPNPPSAPLALNMDNAIGMGWLYALHARSALARGKLWQTAMMLDDLRNQIIALACLRHGLNPWHGRDADRLPQDELQALQSSRATDLTWGELGRSKEALVEQFRAEVEFHDPSRARSLAEPLKILGAAAR